MGLGKRCVRSRIASALHKENAGLLSCPTVPGYPFSSPPLPPIELSRRLAAVLIPLQTLHVGYPAPRVCRQCAFREYMPAQAHQEKDGLHESSCPTSRGYHAIVKRLDGPENLSRSQLNVRMYVAGRLHHLVACRLKFRK